MGNKRPAIGVGTRIAFDAVVGPKDPMSLEERMAQPVLKPEKKAPVDFELELGGTGPVSGLAPVSVSAALNSSQMMVSPMVVYNKGAAGIGAVVDLPKDASVTASVTTPLKNPGANNLILATKFEGLKGLDGIEAGYLLRPGPDAAYLAVPVMSTSPLNVKNADVTIKAFAEINHEFSTNHTHVLPKVALTVGLSPGKGK